MFKRHDPFLQNRACVSKSLPSVSRGNYFSAQLLIIQYNICFQLYISYRHSSLTRQTKNRAKGKGYRYPDRMLRKMDPGIANVWRL